jgi:hypothetical protein
MKERGMLFVTRKNIEREMNNDIYVCMEEMNRFLCKSFF